MIVLSTPVRVMDVASIIASIMRVCGVVSVGSSSMMRQTFVLGKAELFLSPSPTHLTDCCCDALGRLALMKGQSSNNKRQTNDTLLLL